MAQPGSSKNEQTNHPATAALNRFLYVCLFLIAPNQSSKHAKP
jgi:hypothetical protein